MSTSVLIVDDHPRFRRSARAVLESEGFDVVGEAASGEEAVALTAALSPGALLLDVQLPDFDGFEVAARLRDAGPSPRIVLVSTRDSGDFGGKIDASGARGFISKADLSGELLVRYLS